MDMRLNEKEFNESLNKLGELYEEGKDLIIKLLPPLQFGEHEHAEALYNCWREMRDLAAVTLQKLHPVVNNLK